jgi:hypothetical protein
MSSWKTEKRRLREEALMREHEKREAEEAAKNERYRHLPASYRAFDELAEVIGGYHAEKVKALIEAMIAERHETK